MKKILLIIMAYVLVINSYSQCTSTTLISEDFESYTANAGTAYTGYVANSATTYRPGCFGSGQFCITTNAETINPGPDHWKTNLNGTAHGGTKAMIVDGGVAVTAAAWCRRLTLTPGTKYNFSAWYSSPWADNHLGCGGNNNNPIVNLTVNGVNMGMAAEVVQFDQVTNTITPWYQQNCYYTFPGPSIGANKDSVCITLTQQTGGDINACCPGCTETIGANGQGNDILLDDIIFSSVSGAGCPTSGSCTFGEPAPIKLISFDVNNSLLEWVAITDINSAYFVIEKSSNGKEFYEIVKVHVDSLNKNFYQYNDLSFKESSYYRLKMVDLDGKFIYSNIIYSRSDINNIVIFPNPTKNEINISFISESISVYTIRLFDTSGKIVITKEYRATEGTNNLVFEKYPAGLYYLYLKNDKITKIEVIVYE